MAEGAKHLTDIEPDSSPMSFKDGESSTLVTIKQATNVVTGGGNMKVVYNSPRPDKPKKSKKPKKPLTKSKEKLTLDQKDNICKRLASDWKKLGRHIGFDDSLLEQWELEKKPDYTELNFHILTQWERKVDMEATREALATILWKKLGRGDLADFLAD